MHKIAMIKTEPKSEYFWNTYSKRKVDPSLTTQDILKKYKGFEGKLIQLCFNEREVQDFYELLDSDPMIIRLDLFSEQDIISKKRKENFSFLGYEYGSCEEEGALYSSIFNEILFGGVVELREFYHLLNENLLFQDIKNTENYVETHQKLFDSGKDVEWPINMKIYQLWKKID